MLMHPRRSKPRAALPELPRARRAVAFLCLLLGALACGGKSGPAPAEQQAKLLAGDWSAVEAAARGQTVTWAMWRGDPFINDYVAKYVAPELQNRYGVTLRAVSAQGPQVVSMLMTELEARKRESEFDLVWINGETFFQLRKIGALAGPFTDKLPNAAQIDLANPFIRYDFQQDTAGYECPWGNVQLTLVYDSARLQDPPKNMAELEAWVKAHPGRFTLDTQFTGMSFLKSLLISLAGGAGTLDGPFEEQRYEKAGAELWAYVNRIKKYFWKNGETFPADLTQLHQLFASGEVDFTMSFNDGEVDNKVSRGFFPDTARAYVLESGMLQNSHYVGITRNSAHLAGALVAANFLISAEAQYEKLKPAVWGDGTVLDVARLPAPWPERFARVPQRERAPVRAQIQPFALREPDPEYMLRLYKDFRARVIEG